MSPFGLVVLRWWAQISIFSLRSCRHFPFHLIKIGAICLKQKYLLHMYRRFQLWIGSWILDPEPNQLPQTISSSNSRVVKLYIKFSHSRRFRPQQQLWQSSQAPDHIESTFANIQTRPSHSLHSRPPNILQGFKLHCQISLLKLHLYLIHMFEELPSTYRTESKFKALFKLTSTFQGINATMSLRKLFSGQTHHSTYWSPGSSCTPCLFQHLEIILFLHLVETYLFFKPQLNPYLLRSHLW